MPSPLDVDGSRISRERDNVGAAHQAGAMALLTAAPWLRFELRR